MHSKIIATEAKIVAVIGLDKRLDTGLETPLQFSTRLTTSLFAAVKNPGFM
jgi:hypothetical protein